MLKRFLKTVGAAATALALNFGAMGSAGAAVVVGSFDPAFGSPFTDLGFRGTVTMNIPDACLLNSGLTYVTDPGCGGWSMVGGTVDFYNFSLPPVPPTVETLAYTGGSLNVLNIVSGAVTAIGGWLATTEPSSSFDYAIDYGNYSQYQYYYAFDINFGAFLIAFVDETNPYLCDISDGCSSDYTGLEAVTYVVPEPDTIALMLAAVAAMGAVVRRRRTV
jgi:hypothetical protein